MSTDAELTVQIFKTVIVTIFMVSKVKEIVLLGAQADGQNVLLYSMTSELDCGGSLFHMHNRFLCSML